MLESDAHSSNNRNVSFGDGRWGYCLFNCRHVCLLLETVDGGRKSEETATESWTSTHNSTQTHILHTQTRITEIPHWPVSSSAAIHLRSPSTLWQSLLLMWPLLLNYDYLYYPITALFWPVPSFRGHRHSVLSRPSLLWPLVLVSYGTLGVKNVQKADK